MRSAKLPSLFAFQPRYRRGGAIRAYLPLLYDLVATVRPRRLVVLGFGSGDAFFSLCQAVQETGTTCECLAFWRGAPGRKRKSDEAWQTGKRYAAETYGDFARLSQDNGTSPGGAYGGEKIDLLLLDDCETGHEVFDQLQSWSAALSPQGIVLVHGTRLERADAAVTGWHRWVGDRVRRELSAGIGLGISWSADHPAAGAFLLRGLTTASASGVTVLDLYALAVERIEAQADSAQALRDLAALSARQIWLESLLEDRWKAQETMDEQAEQLSALRYDVEALRRDRTKAQLIMDAQAEQLKQWVIRGETLSAERKKLKATVAEQKRILNAAKKACRKKGRCFGLADETKKERRSIPERILRELRRVPANLRRVTNREEQSSIGLTTSSVAVVDRYAEWIARHEPDSVGLEKQRKEAAALEFQPRISLLLPIHNTPGNFLEELFTSLSAQTYDNFEICAVDGGSSKADTIERLKSWQAKEARLMVEFLPGNLGVAENTNRALEKATGDFVACIDHDDRLPPFALYELARAIAKHPAADIFYSDEDRLSATGRRHSPFFKPEWSPEYLLSSMYLGHLTAYRMDLVRRVGRFQPEFDLSQDYDFALRATEQAQEIVHIPHVLYHWREHPASGSAGGKPQARKTNLAALAAAMERRGLTAQIMEYPAANRVRLTTSEWPKVSVIIPTDSAERGRFLVEELPKTTSYPEYEVVIVTNSALAEQLNVIAPKRPVFHFVRYDQAFNFSEKCNLGADAATGSRLIFFNDDVESGQPDWIENLIEPLENRAIGAVAPKLLYETGKIQHAGLVTGVRGLVGTACHQWDADSTHYTNFAQSMRNVSALSGACLAMRRDDFFGVGEWDTTNAPIAHSDLDLCFKIRTAGMRCVYTPFVTMRHRGHASIGTQEKAPDSRREKANVFLLKRWPEFTCHDPYFPDNVRDWLYADSPTPIRMWARDEPWTANGNGDLLLVSHDLSWSGAPMILFQLAQWCKARGYFVTAMSPVDGPMRRKFFEAGIPLLVDPLITTGHPSFAQFAREFDCVIASTIFGAPIIEAAKVAGIPHLWWIHEGRVAEHYLGEDERMRAALARADLIVTPDTKSAQVYQPFTNRAIRVVNYGISDPRDEPLPPKVEHNDGKVRFLLIGTIEHRKGQQVFLDAMRQLPADVVKQAHFQIVGRAHDLELTARIEAAAREFSALSYEGSVPHEIALARIRDADVMISASRDETGPLILMEALAFGTAIVSTTVGCVAENLAGEDAAVFFPPDDDRGLADAITRLVREPELLARLRAEARPAYEKYFAFDRFGREFRKLIDEAIGRTAPNEQTENAT